MNSTKVAQRLAATLLCCSALTACSSGGVDSLGFSNTQNTNTNTDNGTSGTSGTSGGTTGGNGDGGDNSSGGNNGTNADGSFKRDCFWGVQSDPNAVNTLYPDEFAIYWVASLNIPANGKIVFKGEFPHARYMSFNLYNPILQPIDGVADAEIVADSGHINTSLAGADRNATDRSYTFEVIAAVPPENIEDRAPNTLYSFQGAGAQRAPSQQANIIYRVYVPDAGADISGNVGLPSVTIVQTNGAETQSTDACSAGNVSAPPTAADLISDSPIPLNTPSTLDIGFKDLQWLKFVDFKGSQANRFNASFLAQVLLNSPANSEEGSGGFASNIHNAYIYTAFDAGLGDVGVFEGQWPITPTTLNGDAVMGSGDMRYWSICTNENNSQRFIDCMYDEQSVTAGNPTDNRRIFVVTKPQNRPNNATADCGVNWLAWGPQQESLIIVRNMLSENDFLEAIQRIPGPSGQCEAPVMQQYFPYGTHYSKADFEALGCPINPALLPDRSSQYPPNANCPKPATGTNTAPDTSTTVPLAP